MQITYIDIPELPDFGLKAIKMERLGRVVVLAGKNGAGKTRLLGRLNAWTNEKLSAPVISRDEFCSGFWSRKENSERFKHLSRTGWWRDDAAWTKAVTDQDAEEFRLPMLEETRRNLYEIGFDSRATPQIVRFVPKGIHITDPNSMTPAQLQEHARKAESVGVSELDKSALARIQALQNKWWNATHVRSSISDHDKVEAIRNYEGLCMTIQNFLSTNLGRSSLDEATLFGLPVGKAHMSDGQIVLLQFCVAIHAQAQKLSDLIVIMDEPENHLHPGAMIEAINAIKTALSNGQIWIATHSVPLLANFDQDSIWWMEGGTVRHAGSQPEIVLRGLIGAEDRINMLSDFLGLPAALAANNFAYQCLLNPGVTTTNTNDPQSLQIRSLINFVRGVNKLRLVDYGAGRGRLISTIRESELGSGNALNKIDYWAYEKSAANRVECEAAIARLYGESAQRYFSDEREARSKLDSHSVDVVVMCNVLHEIDPLEWTTLFGDDSLLRYLLKPDGFLLLVEDTEMRVGEMAHPRGFLVLDTAELKTLFSIQETDTRFVVNDARGDGRLKAHLIPSTCLSRVTRNSVKTAIQQVRHLAIEEIKRLRSSTGVISYRIGRKHAFYVQQLANAQLALELIGD
jgi:energy-coupling factor transporter ATP-binding protein EcfA2